MIEWYVGKIGYFGYWFVFLWIVYMYWSDLCWLDYVNNGIEGLFVMFIEVLLNLSKYVCGSEVMIIKLELIVFYCKWIISEKLDFFFM